MSSSKSRNSSNGSQSGQSNRNSRNSAGKANSQSRNNKPRRVRKNSFPSNSVLSQNYSLSQSVTAPQAQGLVRRSARPNISRSMNGDIKIAHREYVQDLVGSVAFANNQFPCNPGLASTFPWLSKLAPQYESYDFESLVFEFETTSPTTATGTVSMAVDYDASDAAPSNQTE
jgi:hypothetical protein